MTFYTPDLHCALNYLMAHVYHDVSQKLAVVGGQYWSERFDRETKIIKGEII